MGVKKSIRLFGDNQGGNAPAPNPEFHQRTKHIDIRQRFIISLVGDSALNVVYVLSPRMLANMYQPVTEAENVLHCQMIGSRFAFELIRTCMFEVW